MTDSDGDGLLDCWERDGLDADGDGTVDVDLPAMGADPRHKDLYLEFDWVEPSDRPSQAAIRAIKEAFSAAPIDAGGTPNPDGLPGIHLWVDTGGLTDPGGIEDDAGPGTCGDGLDNGGDGSSDAKDPDCLVGDDLGGGNPVTTPVGCVDDAFQMAKAANFDPARSEVFRYGISGSGGCAGGQASGATWWTTTTTRVRSCTRSGTRWAWATAGSRNTATSRTTSAS